MSKQNSNKCGLGFFDGPPVELTIKIPRELYEYVLEEFQEAYEPGEKPDFNKNLELILILAMVSIPSVSIPSGE